MAQSAGANPLTFSPAGQALGMGAANQLLPGETDEARKRRLAALQASQRNINGALGGGNSLSPAGASLFGI